jgi:predicted nucleic acid-binding OB-fold protein
LLHCLRSHCDEGTGHIAESFWIRDSVTRSRQAVSAHALRSPVTACFFHVQIGYRLCLQLIQQFCGTRFHDDPDANKLRQSCFLSHDPEAFFRADCIPLAVNDQCHVPPPAPLTATEGDITSVQILLDYIPRDLPYDDRFKVSVCVLKMLGRSGITLLMNHWQKKERAELEQQLEDALRGATYGSIYMLQSYAKKYGNYTPSNGGTARRYIQPEPYDYALPPLSTPAEATASLQAIIRECVTSKTSHFVKVTTGAGKTRTVLEALSHEVGHDAKVLFLVPTHDLGDQIIKTYNEIRAADTASTYLWISCKASRALALLFFSSIRT